MSSVEFVATATKYYIIHQILKKVTPLIILPLMFVFGPMPVLIGLGLLLGGCVLWIIGLVIHALCTDGF